MKRNETRISNRETIKQKTLRIEIS